MSLAAFFLVIAALVLLLGAAFGVNHQRVQLVPLALALALAAVLLRLWPP